MRRVFFYVLAIPFFIGLISCSSSNKTDVKDLNGKWTITEVRGNKVTKEKMPFIEFNMDENRVHGNAGCNMFNTTIIPNENDKSAFTMRQAAATMMACPDMELETTIFNTIESIAGVRSGNSNDQMQLVDQSGNVLLVLTKN